LNFPTSKTMRKNLCCLTHPAMVFYGNPSWPIQFPYPNIPHHQIFPSLNPSLLLLLLLLLF
jgi:hypothetical protein